MLVGCDSASRMSRRVEAVAPVAQGFVHKSVHIGDTAVALQVGCGASVTPSREGRERRLGCPKWRTNAVTTNARYSDRRRTWSVRCPRSLAVGRWYGRRSTSMASPTPGRTRSGRVRTSWPIRCGRWPSPSASDTRTTMGSRGYRGQHRRPQVRPHALPRRHRG